MQEIKNFCFSTKRSGFTLIELLIVIAIIGILAGIILMSTSSSRNEALASSTKGVISSLKSSIVLCCSGDGSNTLEETEDADICSDPGGSILPTSAQLNATTVTYSVINDCSDDNPAIDVNITGHPVTACDGHISVTQNGIFNGGDDTTVGSTNGFPSGC